MNAFNFHWVKGAEAISPQETNHLFHPSPNELAIENVQSQFTEYEIRIIVERY